MKFCESTAVPLALGTAASAVSFSTISMCFAVSVIRVEVAARDGRGVHGRSRRRPDTPPGFREVRRGVQIGTRRPLASA